MRIELRRLLINTRALAVLVLLMGLNSVMPNAIEAQNTEESRGSAVHAMTFTQLQGKFYKTKIEKEISVDVHELTLEQALRVIARETGLRLSYRGDIMVDKMISLQVESISISDALSIILDSTGLDYKFSQDGYLLITEKENDLLDEVMFQETVRGTVVDAETGEALPGVNVVIGETTTGTSTNMDGEFELTVASLDETLTFSYIGYERLEVNIDGRSEINVELTPDVQLLDDIVVIGYGSMRRSDLSGSVASAPTDGIERVSLTSIDQGLQGQLPGVFVTQTSGQPGGGTSIRIRGASSINASSEPLYVIDGIPIFNSLGQASANVSQGPNLNPLATINPNEIESVEVLKDASATAIYGSRGANGVIMITTRSGIQDQSRISFESSMDFSRLRNSIDLLNARQFAELTNEAFAFSGDPLPYTTEEINSLGEGVNWLDELFTTAVSQNYNLSISGGNQSTRYNFSGNYADQEGIMIGSDFSRLNFRANINQQLSTNARINSNFIVSRTNSNIIRSDDAALSSTLSQALRFHPDAPIDAFDNPRGLIAGNPVQELEQLTNSSRMTRYIGSVNFEYDLLENLMGKISIGVDHLETEESYYAPSTILIAASEGGIAQLGTVNRDSWIGEATLTYQTTIRERDRINIVGGFTIEDNERRLLRAGASEFSSDQLKFNNLGAGATPSNINSNVSDWSLLSWLGRGNYVLSDKYIFTVTGRIDGSSRFGENNKYGFFPSGAVAWRISEENIFDEADYLDELKLRASFGVSGNQEIGNYQSLSMLGTTRTVLEDVVVGFVPVRVANSDLKWERTEQFNLGLDLEVFSNRLTIAADYYIKRTKDMIFDVPIPLSTGFSNSLQNLGELENKGLEFGARLLSSGTRELSWSSSFNINFNRNKVISLGGQDQIFVSDFGDSRLGSSITIKEGEPLGAFYGFISDGTFRDQQDVDNSATQTLAYPGSQKFRDLNNDGVINDEDRTIIGSAQPKFSGGFSFNLYYRNFQLFTNTAFVYGNNIMNLFRITGELPTGDNNNFVTVLDRWTPENRDAKIPRASRDRDTQFSDRYIEDGSFLRLQNVTLAYNLPQNLLNQIKLSGLRIYVSGKNLAVLNNYSGFDPEVSAFGQSTLGMGFDSGGFPQPRTISIGVNVDF